MKLSFSRTAASARGADRILRSFPISWLSWLLLVWSVLFVRSGMAHEVRPAFLELTERAPGEFDVLWKVPAMGGAPLAGEELPHPQPMPSDDPRAPKTMPCGCPAP